jgi:cytochrome c peroxidase
MKTSICYLGLVIVGLVACTKVTSTGKKQVLVQERLGVDYNDTYPNHLANSFSTINNAKADLGRVLFYDESLSINERVSCSSCHVQVNAFAENKSTSTGFAMVNTVRNSMSLGNTEDFDPLFWDGRQNSLLSQVTEPITNHIEMGFGSLEDMIDRIKTKPYYNDLFVQAFGSNEINDQKVASALSTFISSIRSFRNKLDDAMAALPFISSPWGFNDSGDIVLDDPQAQRGFELFGNLGCASCHSGNNVGGHSFGNIGLDITYADGGAGTWFGNLESIGHFRIPSLRNVALSAPYMHDGRFQTLEQVIEHYNSGIQPHPNLSWRLVADSEFSTINEFMDAGIDVTEAVITEDDSELINQNIIPLRLGLTEAQKADLAAFMRSLTDDKMIRDTRYSNPFDYVAE